MTQLIDEKQAMQLALDISGNHVMCLDLRQNRVFDLHGKAMFGNNVGIEVCYTYIHKDDCQTFKTFIERLAQGLDKEGECRYRWDYNYTGQGEPDWHDMRINAIAEYEDGQPINIIATLTDETQMLRRQRESERLMNRYRQIFENSIIGLSFYSPEGRLLDANRIMREICNFDSAAGDEFFARVNLFDMPPFNEMLDRNNPEDYWACSLSIIPECNMHVYLDINVHPIRDNHGKLVYIAVSAHDVTEEREMYLRARQNEAQLQEVNKNIQLYESELRYMMEACKMQAWRISIDRGILEFYSGLSTIVRTFNLRDMQKIFVSQEDDFVKALSNPAKALSKPLVYVGQMYPVVTQSSDQLQWVQINCIPEYDDNGRLLGAFGVWRNINDLMEKQDQLTHETERANESGHMKSVFLANMTHEIRTPLNAIVGFTDVLSMLSTTSEKQEVIRVIMNNCDMLLRLINDLLVASSIDSSGIKIEPVAVDFAKSFDSVCEELRQRVADTGIEFIKENPYDSFPTVIDDNRVRQVISNFLTNAVKYTHQGHIKLGYRYEDGGLYIYCEDTGEGIAKEVQNKIFDRFFKVNDYIQGTGLGLSISKAIADACHGRIGLSSEGKDRGSTFWFWVPCEKH
ncbi:MAG: PAS domain-containing sensor histidine kinase [Prevotella sp.]|nr:PAS domain-containing sensor histidine kinase [Prevotella sp.]